MTSPHIKGLGSRPSEVPLAKLSDEVRRTSSSPSDPVELLARENQALRRRVDELSAKLSQARKADARYREGNDDAQPWSVHEGCVWAALIARVESTCRIGTWFWDVESDRITLSDQCYRIFGHESGEARATPALLQQLVVASDLPRLSTMLQECASGPTGQPLRGIFRMLRGGSDPCEMMISVERADHVDPARCFVLGTVCDVEQMDGLRDEVQRNADALERVQRLGRLGCWFRDLHTGVLEWSPALRAMLGVDRDTPADDELLLERVHPEDRARIRAVYEEAQRHGTRTRARCRLLLPGDRERWVLMDMGAEFEGGSARAWIGALVDVTEQHQLADELRLSQQRAAVGRLAAGVVHDVSNLVQIIELEARSILEEANDAAEVRDHASAILEVNRRAQVFVRRLLSLRNRARHNPVSVDLDQQLQRLQPLLELALGTRNPLEVALSPLPSKVCFDPAQLEQVVINLVLNARDASKARAPIGVSVRGLTVRQDDVPPVAGLLPGDYCVIDVRDRGHGMSEPQQRRAFEPFFTTKGERGTGLGLPSVNELVRQYGGAIGLDSVVDEGTTASVYIPTEETARRQAELSRGARDAPSSACVVVVDDDVAMASAVRDTLAQTGFEAMTAESVERALLLVEQREGDVQLMLTDVAMQDADGMELTAALQARGRSIPVLYMSGQLEGVRERLPARAQVLAKPFGAEDLLRAVRDELRAVREELL